MFWAESGQPELVFTSSRLQAGVADGNPGKNPGHSRCSTQNDQGMTFTKGGWLAAKVAEKQKQQVDTDYIKNNRHVNGFFLAIRPVFF